MRRFLLLLAIAPLFNACSFIESQPVDVYNLASILRQQPIKAWTMEGRLGLINEKDSISASINWRHQPENDQIELSGPLSQGRVAIFATADKVVFDDGENSKEFTGQIDDVMSAQLGVEVPVNALKFWVLGLTEPVSPFSEQIDGFVQAGWRITFREMQRVNNLLLPKKVNAEKDKTKIKLVIDKWDLS
jgi:outer membrane lipoprotein LolB